MCPSSRVIAARWSSALKLLWKCIWPTDEEHVRDKGNGACEEEAQPKKKKDVRGATTVL